MKYVRPAIRAKKLARRRQGRGLMDGKIREMAREGERERAQPRRHNSPVKVSLSCGEQGTGVEPV